MPSGAAERLVFDNRHEALEIAQAEHVAETVVRALPEQGGVLDDHTDPVWRRSQRILNAPGAALGSRKPPVDGPQTKR
jgi:hypothetical protein